jgi:hypothetical protein
MLIIFSIDPKTVSGVDGEDSDFVAFDATRSARKPDDRRQKKKKHPQKSKQRNERKTAKSGVFGGRKKTFFVFYS